MGAPARRALVGAGPVWLEQLTNLTEAEVMQLHGYGAKGVGIVESGTGGARIALQKTVTEGAVTRQKARE